MSVGPPITGRAPAASPSAGGAAVWARRNRTVLLGVGGAGAVGLAVIMRGRGGSSAPVPEGAIGPQPAIAGYDSTSSDLYGAYLAQQNAFQQATTESIAQQQQAFVNRLQTWWQQRASATAPRPALTDEQRRRLLLAIRNASTSSTTSTKTGTTSTSTTSPWWSRYAWPRR